MIINIVTTFIVGTRQKNRLTKNKFKSNLFIKSSVQNIPFASMEFVFELRMVVSRSDVELNFLSQTLCSMFPSLFWSPMVTQNNKGNKCNIL